MCAISLNKGVPDVSPWIFVTRDTPAVGHQEVRHSYEHAEDNSLWHVATQSTRWYHEIQRMVSNSWNGYKLYLRPHTIHLQTWSLTLHILMIPVRHRKAEYLAYLPSKRSSQFVSWNALAVEGKQYSRQIQSRIAKSITCSIGDISS